MHIENLEVGHQRCLMVYASVSLRNSEAQISKFRLDVTHALHEP
ncbi:hypothetical protein PGA1_262p00790 (plasmid) [Phaeobacter inhibens DSM 17395]|nr:hypothetical protein PGA1_262p00790 [Phaeobacter inhibens DSM 17395]